MKNSKAAKASIKIFGARQNNLKGFDLDIPHDCLTVVTGVSGSGKSSLAFDTIFAEGQWRFLESLPAYARLMLEKASRPQVDAIENIRAAIALGQENTVRSARSTLGTFTELHDLLRVFFARFATYSCRACGVPHRRWTPETAADDILTAYKGQTVSVEVPLKHVSDLAAKTWPNDLLSRGFSRIRLKNEITRLDEEGLPAAVPDAAFLILDRIKAADERKSRLAQALESSRDVGRGFVRAVSGDQVSTVYSLNKDHCGCGAEVPELRPILFSFNSPLGACPACSGFGAELVWDEEKIVPEPSLTLAEKAIEPWRTPANKWWQEQLESLASAENIPLNTPWAQLPAEAKRKVWEGTKKLEGLKGFFKYLEGKKYKMHVRVFLARYRSPRTCPACGGARLRPEALSAKIGNRTIADVCGLNLKELASWVNEPMLKSIAGAEEIIWRIDERLSTLLRLGLHYLTLDRPSRTLSGGERQRAALALQLQNRLAGATYVLDEPTIGLHARDVDALAEVLVELAANGNTVIVVEHDLSFIRRAAHVIELGPGGGKLGGEIVYQGDPGGLARSNAETAKYLTIEAEQTQRRLRPPRQPTGFIRLSECRIHNLKGIDAAVPLGVLVGVSGVSGSGKSSLIVDALAPMAASRGLRGPAKALEINGRGADKIPAVKIVDQAPMGRTPRSIPITYIGVFDAIRTLFAALPASKALGLKAASFSFNVKGGRCERCQGTGVEKIEMFLFEDIFAPCDECLGRRFRPETLTPKYKGLSIADVLNLTVDEALDVFGESKKISAALGVLKDLGMSYLTLGQPATSLSGGEAQRLKIAKEVAEKRKESALFILDEPTTGLHASDTVRLISVLQRLVDAGNHVIAIEHNLSFLCETDWIIDMGPEAGDEGGKIVDCGPPQAIAERSLGHTGRYLKNYF